MTDLLSETGLTRGLCRNGRDSQLLLEEEGGEGGRRGEREEGREGGGEGGRRGGREEGRREGGREGGRRGGREGGLEGIGEPKEGREGAQVLILSPYNEAYHGSYTTSSLLPSPLSSSPPLSSPCPLSSSPFPPLPFLPCLPSCAPLTFSLEWVLSYGVL